jgi:hypothetical protein
MAKAKKDGKPKKNRKNLAKKIKMIQKNQELLQKFVTK